MAIKTLVTLRPGTRQNGVKCLRGQLGRDLVATDPESGRESVYPCGTDVMLIRDRPDGESYRLIALLPDEPKPEPAEPKGRNNRRDVQVRRHFREREGDGVPF